MPDEIEGDQVYFSPEAILKNDEEDVEITTKSDIFSLGILLHQFWTGRLPAFDVEEYSYAGIALLEGQKLGIDPSIPPDIARMISQMLSLEPEDRPTAVEALAGLVTNPRFVTTFHLNTPAPNPIAGPDAGLGKPVVKKTSGGFSQATDDDLL